MSHHEKLVKPASNRINKSVWFKQELSVVSGMALGDVIVAERAVYEGHRAQLHNVEEIAVNKLVTVVGLPVDRFTRSGPIDLASWETPGKVGEYHRSADTFAYSKMVEVKGSERVIKTVAFTSVSREEVVKSFNEADES